MNLNFSDEDIKLIARSLRFTEAMLERSISNRRYTAEITIFPPEDYSLPTLTNLHDIALEIEKYLCREGNLKSQ